MQYRRTAVAPFVILLPEIHVPLLLPGEIPAPDTGGSEPGDDALAVSYRRTRRRRIRRVGALLFRHGWAFLPEQFAVFAVEGHHRAAILRCLGKKNAVAPD